MTVTTTAGLILIIVTLCQALKQTTLPTRYIPVISILLGIAGGVYLGGTSWIDVSAGIISGLSASGLYSGYKKTIING